MSQAITTWFNSHCLDRLNARNISPQEIWYVIEYGRTEHRAGALMFFLGRKDIPPAHRANQRIARLEGTAVLVDPKSGEILTVYRNKMAFKAHRKKQKYNNHRRNLSA